jgi:hypothetical protein
MLLQCRRMPVLHDDIDLIARAPANQVAREFEGSGNGDTISKQYECAEDEKHAALCKSAQRLLSHCVSSINKCDFQIW